jgi:hypothetical protein
MLERVKQMVEMVENHGTGDGGWNVVALFLPWKITVQEMGDGM